MRKKPGIIVELGVTFGGERVGPVILVEVPPQADALYLVIDHGADGVLAIGHPQEVVPVTLHLLDPGAPS